MNVADVDVSKLGAPIAGPTALGSDPRRFWTLARTLAVTDFKLKFFGSVLGYLWQLMRPLLLFGVMFAVFTQVIDLSGGVAFYASAMLLAIVLYNFLSESANGGVKCLVDRENLVRKIDFPRLAVPVAIVMTALLNLGLNLVPVFLFLIIQGGEPMWTWLEIPLLVLALTVLSLGAAMLLSAAFVKYRDVAPITDVVLQALFYGSPIFYTVDLIKGEHADLITKVVLSNPFAAIVQQARHAVIDPSHPSLGAAMGGWEWALIPAGLTIGLFVWGFAVFRRTAPRVAELL